MFNLKKWIFCLTLICLCSFVSAQNETQWRRGLVRVNTNVSAGLETFDEVALQAENAGLDFVIFSDRFLVVAEYGVFPFRHSLKAFNAFY